MQIVIVSDYGEVTGGAAKVAITSARALAERGHRVHFVCALAPRDPALAHDNLEVHHLGLNDVWHERDRLRAALRGIWHRAAGQRLTAVLARLDRRATLVHLHQWTKALSPSAFAAVADAGLPAVITLHDYFLFCPTGLYFDHGQLRPCTRRPLGPRCLLAACDARSRAYKAVRLIRQVGSNAARARIPAPLNLIHVSRPALAVARAHLPEDSRHFVVPNPVPLAPQPAVAVDRNQTFVFLGRYTVDKGAAVLARAAARAAVPVAFLGAGPEEARLRALAPGAEIAAWGDELAVARLLARARALVFPSLWQEASGLVVFEAQAHGVPVICSAGTGAADWIEDGVNGFLVPAGDEAALADRLRRLAADDDLARRMGAAAHARYWRCPLSLARHAANLEACYAEIL